MAETTTTTTTTDPLEELLFRAFNHPCHVLDVEWSWNDNGADQDDRVHVEYNVCFSVGADRDGPVSVFELVYHKDDPDELVSAHVTQTASRDYPSLIDATHPTFDMRMGALAVQLARECEVPDRLVDRIAAAVVVHSPTADDSEEENE